MKVWLDDVRPAPVGWVHAKTADQAIFLFNYFRVEEISLDHDLGDTSVPERDGFTVLDHMEEVLLTNEKYYMPVIHVHTANAAVKRKMKAVVKKIEESRQ